MEGTERTIRIEEDPTRYELLVGPQTAASSWRRTQRAGALFLGAGLMVSTVSFAMQSPLQQDLLEVKPTVVHEKAFIIIVRHGEKHHGDGLSPTGVKRSEYLARCMSQNQPTVAMPFGPPTYVMASHGKPDHSHRPIDTMLPLAKALNFPLDSDLYFQNTSEAGPIRMHAHPSGSAQPDKAWPPPFRRGLCDAHPGGAPAKHDLGRGVASRRDT